MKDFSPLALTSAVVGFPANIGVITRMDGTEIFFTETDLPLTVEGDTYAVVPGLQVSAVKHTSNGEMPSCQMVGVYGGGLTFDAEALDTGLFDGADVQLYKVDRQDLSRKGLMFTGKISNIACDPIEHQFTFSVKGPASSAKKIMVRKRAPMCQTGIYSVLCGANPATYAVATTVATIPTAYTFTVTGALAQASGYFNQGEAVTSASTALEIASWNQSVQTITTYTQCSRLLTVGMSVTLYPGCNKILTDTNNGCAFFGRQLSFQGEPHFLGTAAAAQQV